MLELLEIFRSSEPMASDPVNNKVFYRVNYRIRRPYDT